MDSKGSYLIDRHAKLYKSIHAEDIDIAFFLKPHNVFYLSGYSSVCSGVVVGEKLEPVFCTLWLDLPEAHNQCKGIRVVGYIFPEQTLLERMIQVVIRNSNGLPKRLGVEKDFISLRQFELLDKYFPKAEFVDVTPSIDRVRAIKDINEITKIKKACHIADQAMKAALGAVAPGVSELDVAAEAEYVMRKAGSLKTAFGTFVASGERTLLAHPYASPKIIRAGEMVIIDLGAVWRGYSSDLARTTFAGEPPGDGVNLLRVVAEAQAAGATALKSGVPASKIYEEVQNIFSKENLDGYLPDDIGYGVGLRQSEFYPVIEKGSNTILKQNMVVALLQTTAFHREIGAPRVEDTFLITSSGHERLTKHTQSLCF